MESRKGNRGHKMFPLRSKQGRDVGALGNLFTALLAGLQLQGLRRRLRG